MERIRSFYVYILLFALGTAGVQFVPALPPAWVCILAGVVLAPCFILAVLRPFAFVVLGALWALLRADLLLNTQWPATLEGRDVFLVGTVSGLPERGERYLKFDLDVERARFGDEPVAFSGMVRLRWYHPSGPVQAGIRAGSKWRLRARLKQPHGYYNPGGFHYEAYLYQERVRATGYVRESGDNMRLVPRQGWSIQPVREVLRERLDLAMDGLRFKGMLRALALGDRSDISGSDWETLRATGTSHLIAISGLHVGFAAGIGVLLGLWLGRIVTSCRKTIPAPQVAALGGLCLALLYAALSGFDVPAQRAFVMAAVFLLGALCRRRVWNIRGLCLALAVVLVVNPASIHDPGFWLSFSAVALILAWLARREAGNGDKRVLEAMKLQGLLSLGLLPVVAAFFGAASLASAPANMVAVPVVMFGIVPLCLLSVVLAAFNVAGGAVCLAMADAILALLWRFLSRLGDLDYSVVPLQLEVWQSLILLAGILWLVAARTGARKWGLVCGAVLLAPAPSSPEDGGFRVTVLDVGQGLSAVVKTGQHTLVYDTGPRYPSGFNLADAVVIPYLRSRSIHDIDTLIVSHGDNDHRGGFEALNSKFPAGRILSSVAHELPGAEYCRSGLHWEWDGVEFEILHPENEHPPAHNNASCVLRVRSRHGSVLLTGDIESQAEISLHRRLGDRLKSDVLLVPHQGSMTSSTPGFIERVAPRWAIVSAGYVNRYGHPHPDIVSRYRERGIKLINTARAGAVIAEVSRNGIRVRGWRRLRPRYWLDRSPRA